VTADELLARRLLIVSGKGGVGKSTVAAALTILARNRGKRVLLVEVDAPLAAAPRFDLDRPGVPPVETLNLRPAQVMDEYVRHVVKLELLARRILESPVYRRFFSAAPGLPDLMVLGKIMVLVEERERLARRPRYDLVVVDAPATGHGLAFLRAPVAAARAVPVGPIGSNARRVLSLLRDAQRTALVLVAIPEEMAVVETLEFRRQAREELELPPGAVVLNACHEPRLTAAQEAEVLRLAAAGADGPLAGGLGLAAALEAARRHIRRRKLTRFYAARLARALDEPLLRLPFRFGDALGAGDLEALAARLAAA